MGWAQAGKRERQRQRRAITNGTGEEANTNAVLVSLIVEGEIKEGFRVEVAKTRRRRFGLDREGDHHRDGGGERQRRRRRRRGHGGQAENAATTAEPSGARPGQLRM